MDSDAVAASSATAAQRTFSYKLVLLGDTSVGKSCMVVRFASDEFFEFQEPTIGAAFVTQVIELPDCTVKFDIWDTAGAERYRSLTPMYYRGAVAAVVVYDITSMESFDGAQTWIKELQDTQATQNVLIALCGNKCDLEGPARRVDTALARSFADKHGLIFMETSAKSGRNVTDVFHEIAKRIPKAKSQRGEDAGGFELGKKKPEEEGASWCGC